MMPIGTGISCEMFALVMWGTSCDSRRNGFKVSALLKEVENIQNLMQNQKSENYSTNTRTRNFTFSERGENMMKQMWITSQKATRSCGTEHCKSGLQRLQVHVVF